MTDDDDKVWALYAKGVKKLHPKETEEPIKPPAPPVLKKGAHEAKSVEPIFEAPVDFAPPEEATLDKRVEKNLRQGDVIIEARLDLHGMTEQDAYAALGAFLEQQSRRGKRLLLVITGKGRNGESVLRKNLPRWCAEPVFARFVLAVRPAALCHGGDGAWYVLLRRRVAADQRIRRVKLDGFVG
jgi:DNA-nicking Smr family endonuclease